MNPSEPLKLKPVLVLFFMALGLRFLLLAGWYYTGQGEHLSSDSAYYAGIAKSVARGQGFQHEGTAAPRRVPVYPWVLSLAIRAGIFPAGVQIAQAVLGALTCVLLAGLTRIFFGARTAVIAGFFLAFDYLLAKQCVYILPETLFIFLILAVFYVLTKTLSRLNAAGFALAGFLASLTVLTKEVLSLYFPALIFILFLFAREKRKVFFGALIFMLAYAGGLTPWILRNTRAQGQLSFLTNTSGLTLYLGNNPSVKNRLYGGDWINGVDTDYPVNAPARVFYSFLKADRWYFEQAVDYIRSHPGIFFKNAAVKALRLWYPFYDKSPVLVKWVTGLPYAMFLIFSGLGLYLSRRRWREFLPFYFLIIYLTAIHAVTVPGIRYRYPAMPVLMLFAAFGLEQIWLHSQSKKVKITDSL